LGAGQLLSNRRTRSFYNLAEKKQKKFGRLFASNLSKIGFVEDDDSLFTGEETAGPSTTLRPVTKQTATSRL
jgi:putative heme iron utilization protein